MSRIEITCGGYAILSIRRFVRNESALITEANYSGIRGASECLYPENTIMMMMMSYEKN